jgi:hypothetical protein
MIRRYTLIRASFSVRDIIQLIKIVLSACVALRPHTDQPGDVGHPAWLSDFFFTAFLLLAGCADDPASCNHAGGVWSGLSCSAR